MAASSSKALGLAAEVLNNYLPYDVLDSELADWIDDTQSPHRYYYQPYAGPTPGKRQTGWRPQVVRQNDARPLPSFIRERTAAIEIGTRSGLFAEIHRAWITADDEVFLWNYDDREGEDVAHISGLGEPVVAVGLVVPRPDVFEPGLVRYVLVVATPAEVRLYAVTFGPAPGLPEAVATDGATVPVVTGGGRGGAAGDASAAAASSSVHGRLHLHETALVFPTGGVVVHKIAGTASGRIFLAGRDGCLHEVCYDGLGLSGGAGGLLRGGGGEWLLRTGAAVVSAAAGAVGGVLASALGIPALAPGDPVSKRARRVNHDATVAGSLLRLVAGSAWEATRWPLVDVVVDHWRSRLYTLAEDGAIRAYSLCGSEAPGPLPSVADGGIGGIVSGGGGVPAALRPGGGSLRLLACVPDPEAAAFDYAAVPGDSKPLPQLFQRGLAQATLASVVANPGGAAAGAPPSGGLAWPLVSLHVIPPSESRRVHLVAVSAAGARLYFSLLAPATYRTRGSTVVGGGAVPAPTPQPATLAGGLLGATGALGAAAAASASAAADPGESLTLVYVRLPPPAASASMYLSGAYALPSPDGYRPWEEGAAAAGGGGRGVGAASPLAGCHEATYDSGVAIVARAAGGGGSVGAGPQPLASSTSRLLASGAAAAASALLGASTTSIASTASVGGDTLRLSALGGSPLGVARGDAQAAAAAAVAAAGVAEDSLVCLAHDALGHHGASGGPPGAGYSRQRMAESTHELGVTGRVLALAPLPPPLASLAAACVTCDPGAGAGGAFPALAFAPSGAVYLSGGETAPLPPALVAAVCDVADRVTALPVAAAVAAAARAASAIEGWEAGDAAGGGPGAPLAGSKRGFASSAGPGTPARRGFGVGLGNSVSGAGAGGLALAAAAAPPGDSLGGPSALATQRAFFDSGVPLPAQHALRRALWAMGRPAMAPGGASAGTPPAAGWVTSDLARESTDAGVPGAAAAAAGGPLRGFAVLTSFGLFRLARLRPIDQLASLLLTYPPGSRAPQAAAGAPASSPLGAFLTGFAPEEAAAMCVAVACGAADGGAATAAAGDASTLGSPSATATSSGGPRRSAASRLLEAGAGGGSALGSPSGGSGDATAAGGGGAAALAHAAFDSLCGSQPGWRDGAGAGGGGWREEDVRFSARFGGLQLALARLLRPVWAATVCVTPGAAPAGPGGRPRALLPRFTAAEALGLAAQLRTALAFVERHFSFAPAYGDAELRSLAGVAGMAEKLGISGAAGAGAGVDAAGAAGDARWARVDAQKRANSIEMVHVILAHRLLSRAVQAAALLAALADPASGAVKVLCDLAAGLSTLPPGSPPAKLGDAALLRLAGAVRFTELVTGGADAVAWAGGVLERALAGLRAVGVPGAGAAGGGAAALSGLPGGVGGGADPSAAAGLLSDPAAALAARLRAQCPAFFSESAQLLLSAERLLAGVEGAAAGGGAGGATAAARLRMLDQSLRDAVRGVAGSSGVTSPEALSACLGAVRELAAGYQRLGFYTGVFTLALAAAAAVAPAPLEALPPDVLRSGGGSGAGGAAADGSSASASGGGGGRPAQASGVRLLAPEHGWGAPEVPAAAAAAAAASASGAGSAASATALRRELYALVLGLLAEAAEGRGVAASLAAASSAAPAGGQLLQASGAAGAGGMRGAAAAVDAGLLGVFGGAAPSAPLDTGALGLLLPPSHAASAAAAGADAIEAAAVASLGPAAGRGFAALLSGALRSRDALFHDGLYSWLLERGLGDVLTAAGAGPAPPPFVEPFLRLRWPDADALLRLYLARRDLVRAARLQHALATVPRADASATAAHHPGSSSIWPAAAAQAGYEAPLAERVARLASAVALARQVAGSLAHAAALPPAEVAGWAAALGVLELQLELRGEVARLVALAEAGAAGAAGGFGGPAASFSAGSAAGAVAGLAAALGELDAGALPLQRLYEEVAVPYELHELALVAIDLAFANGGVDASLAGDLARQHWSAAITRTLAALPDQPPSAPAAVAALSALVTSAGRRLLSPAPSPSSSALPVSVAFPLAAVVGELEALTVERGWAAAAAGGGGGAGWLAVSALGAAGVPWATRWDTYRAAADAALEGAADGTVTAEGRDAGASLALHCVECSAALAGAWARAAAAADDGSSFDASASSAPAAAAAAAGAPFLAAADAVLASLQRWKVALPTVAAGGGARAVAGLIDAVRARVAAAQRRVPVGAA